MKGTYTVQCKHTAHPTKNLTLSSLSGELEKARRLALRGLADNYILMTNMGVSGSVAESVRSELASMPGIRWVGVYGATWISLRIRENSRLRMLVPRVYGLGDLSQILDERAYDQAKALLASISDDLAKFVITDAYRQSASAIQEHGFVLLLGEPASGKSTIAATLAIGALDRWNCSTAKLLDAQAFIDHWNPHEPRQFFWIDDVFGATQYQKETALAWNSAFQSLQAAIKRGARVLFTSRDYVFEAALADLKTSAFPLVRESQVIVNVQGLTADERDRILYNHIKLGDQPRSFKTRIKPLLPAVSRAARFLPETARRLGSQMFTRKLEMSAASLKAFAERPLDFLLDVIRSLDIHAKAALALVFMRGGSLESPIDLVESERNAVERLGSTLAGVSQSLGSLNGSLVRFAHDSENAWQFRHPTIADAIGQIIADDPELIDVYLSGTPPEKLVREVTCGRHDIVGAKVVVPQSRYLEVVGKVRALDVARARNTFLTQRCDTEFLQMYLTQYPDTLKVISTPHSFLSATSEAALLARLHEAKLLPERYRAVFVAGVRTLAVTTPDADFLSSERIRAVFTKDEIAGILSLVKRNLLPDLSGEIDNWRWNYNRSEDPDWYFEPLKEALETFAEELDDDEEVQASVANALVEINDTVERLREDFEGDEEVYDELSSSSGRVDLREQERTIFDDLDA